MNYATASPYMSRRSFLSRAGILCSAVVFSTSSLGADDDRRLIVIILRGALDGISAVPPVADPHYAKLRESLALSTTGAPAALPLDGFFALHPAMPVFARLYGVNRALVLHATATNYRNRSHFDGQDVLESGHSTPGRSESGWLNRAVFSMPGRNDVRAKGLAVGPAAPLIMRGPSPVLGWIPQLLPTGGEALAERVLDLYAHLDPVLGRALHAGIETADIASQSDVGKRKSGVSQRSLIRETAAGAALLLAAPIGPRVAALVLDGFDTHQNQGRGLGPLAARLSELDGVFHELEKGLGESWSKTVVLAVTEFGRAVKINGTNGTDHGTGTVAFLCGGGVAGGRVIADWPGLSPGNLYEGRDLAPTTDLRAVMKGVLADHMGISPLTLGEIVFPDSSSVDPMRGLIAG